MILSIQSVDILTLQDLDNLKNYFIVDQIIYNGRVYDKDTNVYLFNILDDIYINTEQYKQLEFSIIMFNKVWNKKLKII